MPLSENSCGTATPAEARAAKAKISANGSATSSSKYAGRRPAASAGGNLQRGQRQAEAYVPQP